MRGQLLKTLDGSLLCDFPERMILIANHQIYTDWLYLWWIGYAAGMHGRIYVILKESLKRIPVIGWGMQFAQFIFLKRKWEQDKPRLASHLQKFNNPKDPMWLMMFPEGTNLADSTRESSRQWADKNGIKDMKHTLLPRSTGLQFILQELRGTVDYVYDCTIAYEGVPRGQYAQDIFTVGASYFGGRPPKSVNMYWRRFLISSIPLDDPKKFDLWLRSRWIEKDNFIEGYLRRRRFPADDGSSKDQKGQIVRGADYIEAEIKPKYWYEFLQVFAPIGLFAMVLYMFYGQLPQKVLDSIKSIDQKAVLRKIGGLQRGEIKIPNKKELKIAATKALHEQNSAQGGSRLKKGAINHGIVTLNGIPQRDFPVKGLGENFGSKAKKVKKPAATPKVARKVAPTKIAPVTSNGVPQKDFPAKGLGKADGVKATTSRKPAVKPKGAVQASAQGPNLQKTLAKSSAPSVASTNDTASKVQSKGAAQASIQGPNLQKTLAKSSAPSVVSTNDTASKVQSKGAAQASVQGSNLQKTLAKSSAPSVASTNDTASKVQQQQNVPLKELKTEQVTNSAPKKAEVQQNTAPAAKKPDMKPKTIAAPPAPRNAAAKTNTNLPQNKREVKPSAPPAAAVKPEVRQGKQEPKRKIRRALDTTASKT